MPFSNQIQNLLVNHLEHLQHSAISLELIKQRGYKSILGKTDLKNAGFSKAQQRTPGILIPLHGVDGTVYSYQYRPDNPRTDPKRDRSIKYENPTGSSVRLDVPPCCRAMLGDPSIPLWITEGIKKVDALASVGACAIGLTGVWGFKGKNILGGTTILADFDYIALKGRVVNILFDSDSSSNPHVIQAMTRLVEHLNRKGATTNILQLPAGPKGAKVGADDYLAAGHSIEEIKRLEAPAVSNRPTLRQRSSDMYCVEEGRLCWMRQTREGEVVTPLCDFNAHIRGIITRDNGVDITKAFTINGTAATGQPLEQVEVPTANFESMSWVTAEWDTQAIISANQAAKSRLREAIMLQSRDAARRHIYAHTGWREIDGVPVFLTAAGALGAENVEVEVEEDLKHYCLPQPTEDPTESLRASYDFLKIGSPNVLLPLWAMMYLAPLSEVLEPAFTLFMVGHSGSFKSTISALALNHFGPRFDEYHLPAAWRDTENKLEKLLFLCKDLPLIIDDWAPGSDSAKARELEVKAEHVIRAQGNRQGKGRLRADTSSRKTYIPRGLLITSGEQLPSGHSHTARIFAVEITSADIDLALLSDAQVQKHHYSQAMTHYILWLQKHWNEIRADLPKQYLTWRDQARQSDQHPRLPGVVAWLYTGLTYGLDFMSESGAITEVEAKETAEKGLETFIRLSAEQSSRVEEERPGRRFIEVLRSMIDQGKATLWPKDEEEPRKATIGETAIGWRDSEGHVYLNPMGSYAAVRQFCQYSDAPFTFKQNAVWKDMRLLNYIEYLNGRNQLNTRIYGQVKKVIKVRPWVLQGGKVEQGELKICQ